MAAHTSKTTDFKPSAKKTPDNAAEGTSNVVEAWFTQSRAQFDRLSQAYSTGEQAEALTRSTDVLTKGARDFFKTCTDLVQEAAERNAQSFKTLMTARTITDATEAQSRLAQDSIDGFLTSMTTLSQMAVRVATDSFAPINAQMSRKSA